MAITVDIKGIPGVSRELWKAANRYQTPSQTRKIIRPAAGIMSSGLKSVVGTSFPAPTRSTGNLRRSIRIMQFARARNMHVRRFLFVGANLGKTARYPDGFYFSFQDRGTKTGIRAKFMMDRAYNANASAAGSMMVSALLADLKYLL